MPSAPDIMDHDAALAFLFGRIDYERADRFPYRSRGLKLDRMRELASRLGDPHERFPIVHVAGTKGKGSTSTMIADVLSAAGYRTGLYTSPHVTCVEERLQVDGRLCGREEFVELIRQIRPAVDAMDRDCHTRGEAGCGPTYFEITTAAALLHFAHRQVDVAVLEVGLGGRLDSTNICRPQVSVITSISFDHMRQLGNTLAAIAGERRGSSSRECRSSPASPNPNRWVSSNKLPHATVASVMSPARTFTIAMAARIRRCATRRRTPPGRTAGPPSTTGKTPRGAGPNGPGCGSG